MRGAQLRGHRPSDSHAGLGSAASLTEVVEDLAGEFSLRPLLARILRRSTELLGTDAGSICLVDLAGGTYRKEADIGVSCQSGKVFPLTEGTTGAIVAADGPVIFNDYGEVPGGHVTSEDRATLRGVIGVPIRWRGEIIGSCVVFSRDAARVFGVDDAELLQVFADHAAIAIENARLHEAVEANARAESATAERNRLAREVHDTIAQGLASIMLQLRAAATALDDDRGRDAAVGIDEARRAAEAAFEETRRSVLGLAPTPLEGHTLEEALELEIGWVNRAGAADVRLVTAGEPRSVPAEHALTLFRIAQESLTNAIRHANARSVRVGVVHGGADITLLVQDDGAGFDRAAVDGRRDSGDEAERHGLGLIGMVERAELVGGTVEVESTPGWGTRVRASIPRATSDAPGPDIDVLVVDDHPTTRAGLVRVLDAPGRGIRVVGEAASAEQAVDAWRVLRPSVTLMDLQMPGDDGIAAITRIRTEEPDASIIALSAFTDDRLVAGAMKAGARGYLGKEVALDELVRAVRAASRGETVLSADATDRLHEHLNGGSAVSLTDRERQVLELMERGSTDREIADLLGISVKTVEKHVGSILRKTGAQNRTHAAALSRETRTAR